MQTYTGRIVRFLYKSDRNDWGVASFRTAPAADKPEEEIKIKSESLKRHVVGKEVCISGEWEQTKHGPTFNAITVNLSVPRDKRAILEYLKTYVAGVGQRTLERLVEFFGEDTLEVIRSNPQRLNEMSKLGPTVQKKIVSGCRKEQVIKDLAIKIDQYDVPVATATKLYDRFGDDVQEVLDANPYAGIGTAGYGFKSADRMAKHREDYREDSVQRVSARIESYLHEQSRDGHTCAPKESVIQNAVETCGVGPEIAERSLSHLLTRGTLVHDVAQSPAGPIDMIFLPYHRQDELAVTGHINRILYAPVEKPAPKEAVLHVLGELEQAAQKNLTDEQKKAVERAFTEKISVLTGRPGTGKTTSLRAIVAIAKRLGLKYGLCAPTGRAAQNMTKACGEKAVTIHRLLEYDTKESNEDRNIVAFKKDENHQLGYDLLLVDEASMVDTRLLRSLVEAVPNGCRLALIGDDNQLPSVGAGRCLHDFIRSGICPVTELHIIHRQAQDSNIILNAHHILDGQRMVFPCRDVGYLPYSDCAFLEAPMVENPDTEKQVEDAEWVKTMVRHLCSWYLPQFCGVDPIRDVQILTPRRTGKCAVNELNQLLQHSLNPNGKPVYAIPTVGQFRQGDRVMCIQNNYDLNIFNGDVGIVVDRDISDNTLVVNFYGEEIKIPAEEMNGGILTLAYATTIHKSQGSEYPVVILLILKQHGFMLQRNLLYTGVTRAKQRLAVVGSKQALTMAIRNVKPVQRNTLLWHRLSRLKLNAQPARHE